MQRQPSVPRVRSCGRRRSRSGRRRAAARAAPPRPAGTARSGPPRSAPPARVPRGSAAESWRPAAARRGGPPRGRNAVRACPTPPRRRRSRRRGRRRSDGRRRRPSAERRTGRVPAARPACGPCRRRFPAAASNGASLATASGRSVTSAPAARNGPKRTASPRRARRVTSSQDAYAPPATNAAPSATTLGPGPEAQADRAGQLDVAEPQPAPVREQVQHQQRAAGG